MKQNEAENIARNLSQKYGLLLRGSLTTGNDIIIQPGDVHPHEGFQIKIQSGWRNITMEFHPGKFAAELIHSMEASTENEKAVFCNICRGILDNKATIELLINGRNSNPLDFKDWPRDWRTFNFKIKKSPLEINTEDFGLTEKLVSQWTEKFTGSILALMPFEEEGEPEQEGLPEGSIVRVEINKYERSLFNRTLCTSFYGFKCKVCDFDFVEVYGKIGEGFIHVHHVTPVSVMGPEYAVDPLKDLIPVCPNCHAMIHKRKPPYSVMELKELIKERIK